MAPGVLFLAAVAAVAARMKRLALWLACCAIPGAYAMMTPEEYRAARNAASHWLQVRIDAVRAPDKKRGERSPPGDEFRVDAENLVPGWHLEAFADVRDGRYVVAARQIELVAQPGPRATFTGKE